MRMTLYRSPVSAAARIRFKASLPFEATSGRKPALVSWRLRTGETNTGTHFEVSFGERAPRDQPETDPFG